MAAVTLTNTAVENHGAEEQSVTTQHEIEPNYAAITGENGRIAVETLSTDSSSPFNSSAYLSFYQTYGIGKEATVYYNGQRLDGTDAFPLVEQGTTFIPLALFSEAIGADVEYDHPTKRVTLSYQGNTISFIIGESTFSVNDGEVQELPFATFVANSRTMVPVRFITDAFGLSLYWNASNRQVIAADLDSLKGGDYDLLTSWLALLNTEVTGKNVKVSGDLMYSVAVDQKNMEIAVGADAFANEDLSSMELSMEFAVDISQFQEEVAEILAGFTTAEEKAIVQTILDSLGDFDLEYILDFQNMDFYIQSDLVNLALPLAMSSYGISLNLDADSWLKLSLHDFMSDLEIEVLQLLLMTSADQDAVLTVDQLIDQAMELTRSNNNDYLDVYGTLETLLTLLDDSQFANTDKEFFTTGEFVNDSFFGVQSVQYGLSLITDGNLKVVGYEVELNYVDSADSINFNLGQSSSEDLSFSVNLVSDDVNLEYRGDFTLEYTDEVAASVPNSNKIVSLG